MSYKGGGANVLAKVPLGSLKPVNKTPRDDNAAQYAKLERIAMQQSEEIAKLEQELLDEQEKNAQLQQQLDEMTQFLEDYDLHWVGGPGPKDNTYEHGPDDMNTFMVKIDQLNRSAMNPKIQIKRESNIYKADFEKPIIITLYNTYFTVNDSKERPYNLPMSAQFFRDIYDGFYPSEFKDKYPDGFHIKVVDKRGKEEFQGKGHTLEEYA